MAIFDIGRDLGDIGDATLDFGGSFTDTTDSTSAGVGVLERSLPSDTGDAGVYGLSFGFVNLSRSIFSSCKAVSMALRTSDEVEECEGGPRSSGGSDSGGRGGRSFDEAIELGGRSDWAEGRRLGNVLMEPVTDVPVDLELMLVTLFALEDASLDNLDCVLAGIVEVGVAERAVGFGGKLDLDSKSGMVGILLREDERSLVVPR